MCDESVTRNVLRHSTWQVQRRLWVAAQSSWVFTSHKSVSLMAQASLAPQSTSLAWDRLNDCRRAHYHSFKGIALHRRVRNLGWRIIPCAILQCQAVGTTLFCKTIHISCPLAKHCLQASHSDDRTE